MKNSADIVSSLLSSYKMSLSTQEEFVKSNDANNQITIGIPKECDKNEKRIGLTPEGVETLVSEGYKVIVEHNAGKRANFSDLEYSERGAIIVNSPEEVFKSDVILKINHPLVSEIEMMQNRKTIISTLYRGKPSFDSIKALMHKKITSIAIEQVTDEWGYSIRNTLFPLEGKAVTLMAAELLTNERGGQGILLGGMAGISPVEIVIIGADIIAEYATQVATALGANVKIFSSSLDAMLALKEKIGQSLYTCTLRTPALLNAFSTANVIINTLNFEKENSPFYFTEQMFEVMKKQTIVLDMSVKSNAFCKGTNDDEYQKYLLEKYHINYHCVVNISSRVAHTASIALNNLAVDVALKLGLSSNIFYALSQNKGLRKGVYTFNGILTNEKLGRKCGIPHQNIELLLATF